MTKDEAAKVIDLCNDTTIVEGKVYVSKEYVMCILDMISDNAKLKTNLPNAGDDNYPWGWPKVYYSESLKGPYDVYGNPVVYCPAGTHKVENDSGTDCR